MIDAPVPSRGTVLATQLTQATTDLLAVAAACDEGQWYTRCANEERTGGDHHVAIIYEDAPTLTRAQGVALT